MIVQPFDGNLRIADDRGADVGVPKRYILAFGGSRTNGSGPFISQQDRGRLMGRSEHSWKLSRRGRPPLCESGSRFYPTVQSIVVFSTQKYIQYLELDLPGVPVVTMRCGRQHDSQQRILREGGMDVMLYGLCVQVVQSPFQPPSDSYITHLVHLLTFSSHSCLFVLPYSLQYSLSVSLTSTSSPPHLQLRHV